jgi:hypothetical protein
MAEQLTSWWPGSREKRDQGQTLVAHALILATQEAEIRRISVQSQPGEILLETLSQKYPTQKRGSGVIQVVEHLPSKHEPLSSNSRTAKKKKKKKGRGHQRNYLQL